MVQDSLSKAIVQHGLDHEFLATVNNWYLPLAQEIANERKLYSPCFFLGVQGCQGSGKSTLAAFLKIILEEQYRLSVATLSLDDFYLTLAERQQLASSIHPLFITRGVPGTHDTNLAASIFSKLASLQKGERLALPRFDKACDDRAPPETWPTVKGPIDIVIFEGWCVGVSPEASAQLNPAINELELTEDPNCEWRQHVNTELAGAYAKLFASLNKLVVLNAPSFACVYTWRSLQEQKLAQKVKKLNLKGSKILSENELERFISHYQRLTQHCIHTMPDKADWLLPLNEDHQIIDLKRKL